MGKRPGRSYFLARVKLLEDREGLAAERSRDDVPIKGRNLNEGEAASKRVSDDTKEMATVLTSMDAETVLASGVAEVPTAVDLFPLLTQQRRPWSKKQKRDYYMAVIRSNLDRNFIPMGSKEETERFKRKLIRFEQESVKKLKTSEEVPEEVKTTDEVPEEKVKEMMQLVPIEEVYVEALQVKHPIIDWKVHTEGQRSYWKITRLGDSSASYQFFIDMLKHLDREDLNQLWALVKESLSNRPSTSDKEMELWVELKRLYEPDDEDQLWTHTQNLMHALVEWKLYDTYGVHHVTAKDKEIFMLVEKDY
nr:hypothetical protein [Tanacetum cinerariifolium]